jgi:hypothetical protein
MSKQTDDSRNHAISEAEQERRKKAVDFARASLVLEGFKISDAAEERARRLISGEIDLVEFVKMSNE